MLSEDGDEDNVQWFADRVAAGEEIIFERRNSFVRAYCREVRRLVEGEEGRRGEAIAVMRSQIDELSPGVAREEATLRSLGPDYDALVGRGTPQQLVELASLLGVGHPLRYGEYQVALDALSQRARQAGVQLSQVTSLQRTLVRLAEEIREHQVKLAAAREDFDRWARRDCEAGMRELREATATVCRKRTEYRERLADLDARWREHSAGDTDGVGASTLLSHLEKLQEGRRRLEQAQQALAPYHQLPPDPSLASIRLEEARQELARLMAQRNVILRSYRI